MVRVSVIFLCITITSAHTLRNNTLDGEHLRIPAFHIPPQLYMEKDPEGKWTYRGSTKDVMDHLAKRFNFRYTFVNVDPVEIREIGQKKASINMLLRKEIDMVPYKMLGSPELLKYVEYSVAIRVLKMVLLIPYPKEEDNGFSAVFKPFSLKVWIMLLISLIATPIALTCIKRRYSIEENRLAFADDLNDMSMYIMYTTLGQSSCYLAVDRFSLRIVVAAWSLAAIVILYSYKGTLLSFMAAPVMTPMVTSLDDLAQQNELSLLIEANSPGASIILNTNKTRYKLIADSIRNKPENFFKTENELMQKMMTGKHVYIATDLQANYYVGDVLKSKGHCTFTITDTDASNTNYLPAQFVLPKNGAHNQLLNSEFLKLWDNGLMQHIDDRYTSNIEKCIITRFKKAPLTLHEMVGPFILLGIGITFSLMAFIFEKWRARKRTTPVLHTPSDPADNQF